MNRFDADDEAFVPLFDFVLATIMYWYGMHHARTMFLESPFNLITTTKLLAYLARTKMVARF